MWKTIQEYPTYEVSELGKVRNKVTRKLLRPSSNKSGYLRVNLYSNKKCRMFYVHRLVAELFVMSKSGQIVNHKDGDNQNNVSSNLEWVTQSENLYHSARILKRNSGENHGSVILTEAKVIELRLRYASGHYTHRELGEVYGVSRRTVGDIVNRRVWKNI